MAVQQLPVAHTIEALYVDHHGWLQGWLRGRLGNAGDAADLTQDTYVRVMVSERLPAREQARSFLMQIAKGLVIDLHRRRQLEHAYYQTLAQLPEALVPSPEERALLLQTLIAIDTALDALPARVRETFLLSQFDGLTYSEIALRQNISVGAVRKYMLKAAQACLFVLAA